MKSEAYKKEVVRLRREDLAMAFVPTAHAELARCLDANRRVYSIDHRETMEQAFLMADAFIQTEELENVAVS